MSGLSGGITSSISGGNFWRGFGQGMIIEGFNHLRKQILAPTEKYIVEEGETFSALLAEKTGKTVINAGIPTYGPPEYTAIAKELIETRKPKTLIYTINFVNDLFLNHNIHQD